MDIDGLKKIARRVSGVVCDSRKVRSGFAFAAIPGTGDDGSRYVAGAIEAGAAVVLVEEGAAIDGGLLCRNETEIVRVPSARKAFALLAEEFYGNPSEKLSIYAVTGTNGKTTVAGLVRDILNDAGRTSGLLSTVEYSWPGHSEHADRTTPDAAKISSALSSMVKAGCRSAAMEASSHGIDQERTSALRFRVCAFTSLSQDHFDYHRGFEDYYLCKRRLFEQHALYSPGAPAVVNIDDPYGERLYADAKGMGLEAVGYSAMRDAAVSARNLSLLPGASHFTLNAFGATHSVSTSLCGRFNISNILAALSMTACTGIPLGSILDTVSQARPRWGRLERVSPPGEAAVFVDYAHSPDAIEKVLAALREITQGRLAIVFGCGGDRDRAKRPLMASAASRLADMVVLTTDNPRSENPEDILDDMEKGIGANAVCYRIPDRREAIRHALLSCKEGDTVLVAGKGHEDYQIVKGEIFPFDDRAEVRAYFAAKGSL